MFYCDPCAEPQGWPQSFMKSKGRCEICGTTAVCNDVPSAQLPYPKTMSVEEIAAAEAFIEELENMPQRFFLKRNDEPEREVTKEEFISAERAAGFHNTAGKRDQPATGDFFSDDLRGHRISGRSEYVETIES